MIKYHKIHTIYKRDKNKKIIKSDFSRPEFEYLYNNKWLWTEKVNGANIRVMWHDGIVEFGGKTDNAIISPNLLNKLIELFPASKFIDAELSDICFYGEGYGAGMAKGSGNYSAHQDFVLFDIKIGDWWLLRKDVEDIAKKVNIPVVPIVGTGTLFEAEELVKNGFTSKWGDFLAEGLVLIPEVPLLTRGGARVITKLKHKDFK